MTERFFLLFCLTLMGAGWGLTLPLAKIAVSEGYRNIGLIFWQLLIGAIVMGTIQIIRGRRLQVGAPQLRVFVVIALIGTLLPNSASYEAARHLPAGLIAILLSLVPLIAFPLALALGNEKFALIRLMGLGFGLFGVLLIVGPDASLPERAMIAFIPLALIAPTLYALESNVVAKWGTAGLDGIDVLFGASIFGALLTLPLSIATGTFIDPRPPWGAPDGALVLSSVVHVFVYATYVWMVGRAGPLFTVQVSYLVTGFGVLWSMILLGENYSLWVWAAMVLILSGVFLVLPRPRDTLAAGADSGKI